MLVDATVKGRDRQTRRVPGAPVRVIQTAKMARQGARAEAQAGAEDGQEVGADAPKVIL